MRLECVKRPRSASFRLQLLLCLGLALARLEFAGSYVLC